MGYGPGDKRGPEELVDFQRIPSSKLKNIVIVGNQVKADGDLHG